MTTELMTTPIIDGVEQTQTYPLGVTALFFKHSETRHHARATADRLSKEKQTGSKKNRQKDSIERRLSGSRVAAAIDVTLFNKGKWLAKGTIRNLAQRGLFVEASQEIDEDTLVQLRVCLPKEQASIASYQLWGSVAHRSDKGIGVHLDILHPETDAGLQALRNHADS